MVLDNLVCDQDFSSHLERSLPSSDYANSSIEILVSPSQHIIEVPDRWRPDVELCIENKCITSSDRNQIVRNLVSIYLPNLISRHGPSVKA